MTRRELSIPAAVRCVVSCVFVLASQVGLAAVARFATASSLLEHVAVSGAVLAGVFGFGRFCKRVLAVKASASASVILHLLFIWGVYLGLIRRSVSLAMDAVVNLEIGLVIFGMWRIMHSDPGWVAHDSISVTNPTVISGRVRHCKSCKVFVKGYDHHCPAFGNCIGQKNHVLFLLLLVLFILTEVSYAACCYQYIITTQTEEKIDIETCLSRRLAISTMTFCLFQVTWEVFFLAWHIYCICNNIRTDEWVSKCCLYIYFTVTFSFLVCRMSLGHIVQINWTKYPEFHREVLPLTGHIRITFNNPYNKGVLGNLKEFYNQR